MAARKKERQHSITSDFLLQYQLAALRNAKDLLEDALVLLKGNRHARAYFLATASIEETGKAWLAFSARGRNLSDEGLKIKLKQIFEDHSKKTTSAFVCWIIAAADQKAAAKQAVDLTIHLQRGRELSMYVDASLAGGVSEPSEIVRPEAAVDACKLAGECLMPTLAHLAEKAPPNSSSYDDKLMCLSSEKLQKIMNDRDFWEYLVGKLGNKGTFNYSQVVVSYHEAYFSKGKKFVSA